MNRRTSTVLTYISVVGIGAIATFFGYKSMPIAEDWDMVVGYPIKLLNRTDHLVDPQNLDSVYEYYLLENLGAGLVRDDASAPSGYRGELASEWKENIDGSWTFKIKPELKWSNAEPIELEAIAQLIKQLATQSSRHVTVLKQLKNISVNQKANTVTLHFDNSPGSALLHELSLADSVLVKTGIEEPFTVTSGPYFWNSFGSLEQQVELKRNRHYMHFDSASPATVALQSVSKDSVVDLIEDGKLDLIGAPSPPFADWISEARQRTTEVVGAPTVIYFLSFEENHPLHSDLSARLAIADWARTAVNSMQLPDSLKAEDQMIPEGYPGRVLATSMEISNEDTRLRYNLPLEIDLPAGFKQADPIISRFTETARQRKLPIELTYQAYTSNPNSNALARMVIFSGNQKDPIGNWSFLFKGNKAPLRPFNTAFTKFEKYLGNEKERNEVLLQLHQEVLENAYAIPLFVEGVAYFTSKRLNLERWNRFDMRYRFYDARIER